MQWLGVCLNLRSRAFLGKEFKVCSDGESNNLFNAAGSSNHHNQKITAIPVKKTATLIGWPFLKIPVKCMLR